MKPQSYIPFTQYFSNLNMISRQNAKWKTIYSLESNTNSQKNKHSHFSYGIELKRFFTMERILATHLIVIPHKQKSSKEVGFTIPLKVGTQYQVNTFYNSLYLLEKIDGE